MAEGPSGDVERIYALLEILKKGQGLRFIETDSTWEVSFHGDASFRHANRISKFREFLTTQLQEDVKVAGARPGSVVIEYAMERGSPSASTRSKALLQQRPLLMVIAMELGIKSIKYGHDVIEFEHTGLEVVSLPPPVGKRE